VKVVVNDGDRQLPVSITYMEPSSYPRSGCLILCDEDKFSCKLSAASERFQDSAALSAVLAKVRVRHWQQQQGMLAAGCARAVFAACWKPCVVLIGSCCLQVCWLACRRCWRMSHAVVCMLLLLQICQVLDVPIDEDALRAADGKPNDGTGMEKDGSDEVRMAWLTATHV
jgi:hypothetical protein